MSRWAKSWSVARPVARVLCLPRAGGSAFDFRPWSTTLGDQVEAWAIQAPGRLDRFREPPVRAAGPIVEAAVEVARGLADLPLVLFGDCMGAILAFEIARKLRRHRAKRPAALVVASYPPPDLPRTAPDYHDRPAGDLRGRLAVIGGVPPDVLADDEWFALMLPTLRADFAVFETYRYRPEPALDIPIHAIGGALDDYVPTEQLKGWRAHTTRAFVVRVFTGGHFFLRETEEAVTYVKQVAIDAARGST